LYEASLDASEAIRSKISETKELRIAMALLLVVSGVQGKMEEGTYEIPVSGWTCLRTL
jgi:hypothetical protein